MCHRTTRWQDDKMTPQMRDIIDIRWKWTWAGNAEKLSEFRRLMDLIRHGLGAGGNSQCIMLRFFSLRLTVSPWWSLAMAILREIMAILPWGKTICKRQRPNHTNNRCVFWQLVWSWSSWCWSLDFASLGIQHWFLVNVLRILELTFG